MFQSLKQLISFYLPPILLTIIGLVTIYSIKPDVATTQLVFFALSLIASIIVSKWQLNQGWLPAIFWLLLVIFSLFFTGLFGVAIRGSSRWISLFGQQFQTSEFAKVGLILFTATWFSKKSANNYLHIFKYIIYLAIPAFIIYRQPDLGSALMIAVIGLTALLSAGTSLKKIIILIVISAVIIPLSITQLKPYQQARLDSFINPQNDPLGSGYNVLQATIAVGSGQLLGRGLGQGTQSHLRFLPERHTDFIYASIVEEMGFLGGSVVIIMYLWLGITLISSSRQSTTTSESLVRLIFAGLIIIQTFVNIGMNMGIMPITGVTLPFVSYGGSSLLSMYLLLGISLGHQTTTKTTKQNLHLR